MRRLAIRHGFTCVLDPDDGIVHATVELAGLT